MPSPPKSKLAATELQRNQQTEEILDSVLPPKEWSEEGQLWVQRVSSTPATRLDVINLQVGHSSSMFIIYVKVLCAVSYITELPCCYNYNMIVGAAGHSSAAATGTRDRDMSCTKRALLTVLWSV